jgi:proteasome lid subunit RPN8/RPN11
MDETQADGDGDYLQAPGEIVNPEQLTLPKAKDLARIAQREDVPYVGLHECRTMLDARGAPAGETVVLDVEVELSQRIRNGIQPVERISVTFWADDEDLPLTLALRPSFPLVPHLNLSDRELPRSLCLFQEPYSELKLRWTALWFVETLRTWLARTALGKNHAEDQALEPLILGASQILVVPREVFTSPTPLMLSVYAPRTKSQSLVRLVSSYVPGKPDNYLLTLLIGQPQVHGILRKRPVNLWELHQFLDAAGIDLLSELRRRLQDWYRSDANLQADFSNLQLILLVALPKQRSRGRAPEAHDIWAFVCADPIRRLGDSIDAWEQEGQRLRLKAEARPNRNGIDVSLEVWNVIPDFDRESANLHSGLVKPDDARVRDWGVNYRIAAVGLGALGSQVFTNFARMGYGRWTLIDEDYMYPHNLSKHALFPSAVGLPKVEALTALTGRMLGSENVVGIVADVMRPRNEGKSVSEALKAANVILDMSASTAVARYLAHYADAGARRASLFLNPAGTDLVMLVEDRGRQIRLDALEMQYYRHLIESRMTEHLRPKDGRIRYGRSCRDISSTLSQELVALHAASGTRALRSAFKQPDACIVLWQTNDADFGAVSRSIPTSEVIRVQMGEWTMCTDRRLVDKVVAAREGELPSETGGVLVGSFDMERHILYVVDVVPSPPDSVGDECGFTRGLQGLEALIGEIERMTNGMVTYVGEWHSHPCHYGCTPSTVDLASFRWLADLRGKDGLPGHRLIVGDNGEIGWFLS